MKIKTYSSNEEEKLIERTEQFTKREDLSDNIKTMKVFPHLKKHKIQGFGGSFTEASGLNFNKLSPVDKEKVTNFYFSDNGNKYNLVRIPIQSCDFSEKNYQYVKDENDIICKKFDFSVDQNNIIPFITASLKKNSNIEFMASPWSPPDFMKTNKSMNGGGYLKKNQFKNWGKVIHAYLDFYYEKGIKIKKVSVQNEPIMIKKWESCLYSNKDEAYFAVDILKKELKNTVHSDIKIYIWDHDKDGLIDWCTKTFSEDYHRNNIDGVAFHWYSGDHFDQIDFLKENYPEKDLLFTEGCLPLKTDSHEKNNIRDDSIYIHEIIQNLKHGGAGFIDWNLLLDQNGGVNHMHNRCESPIMYDTNKGEIIINNSFYLIGHFSRFIKEGAHVVYSSIFDESIEQVCFLNPDGGKIAVMYNGSNTSKKFRLVDSELETRINLKPYETKTYIW